MIDGDILEYLTKVKEGKIDIVEEIENIFVEIEKYDRYFHSFLRLYKEEAIQQAKKIFQRIKNQEKVGKLAGFPVAIKDNICYKDHITSCASKILENFIPPYNATVIERLIEADAIVIGSTNMDEFAMGSSCENSAFGITRNPWDITKIPGGSSGGSSVAVAAGFVPVSLGSDTGGSIRQPASLCGVVGIKPTYGLVSRYGLVAFASSLDQIGTFGRNIKDAALVLDTIKGHDPKDSTSAPRKIESLLPTELDLSKLIIGVPKEYFIGEGIQEEVKEKVKEAIKILEQAGARIREISLPHTEYAVATYYIIATAEASSNLARYDGMHYGLRVPEKDIIRTYSSTRQKGFGEEVIRRIMLGTFVLSSGYYDAYYLKALKVRRLIKQDFENAFKNVDVIVCPTSPTTAFNIGEKVNDPLSMYLSDIFTISVNLAGLPAVSIPCGFDNNGLPIGLQIIGNTFNDKLILDVGFMFEKLSGICNLTPDIEKVVNNG